MGATPSHSSRPALPELGLLLYAEHQMLKRGEHEVVVASLERRARRYAAWGIAGLVVYAVLIVSMIVADARRLDRYEDLWREHAHLEVAMTSLRSDAERQAWFDVAVWASLWGITAAGHVARVRMMRRTAATIRDWAAGGAGGEA